MSKLTKLIILIILSLSVYFIYNITMNSKYKIINLGDKLSLGYNSYGIKEASYIDYYKDYLLKEKKEVEIINEYSKENQSIKNILYTIKNTSSIKKDLLDSNILIITLGYNDLLYDLSLEENKNPYSLNKIISDIKTDYNNLIKEISKYYHKDIIVIGYYKSNKNDYYINQGIIRLNQLLKSNKNIYYINTYDLINNPKYFNNPDSYYPNIQAYQLISKKIISKTLEIS